MADLLPSMLLGCRFWSCNMYSRKSVTDFIWGSLKSTWLLWHHYCKNHPLCLTDWSGWDSMRSLNMCCHTLREALLLDSWGSRCQAWRLRFDRFLWRMWLNGWVNRLGRHNGIWLYMATRSQAWSHPGGLVIWSNLLLNLVANRSSWGCCHQEQINWKTSGKRDHSVPVVWPRMDSLFAITCSRPGMCLARVTCFRICL